VKQRIPTAVAVIIGLITLLGYLIAPLFPEFKIHLVFIHWASILAAVALILGIFNLLGVHLRRITSQERNWPYSIALILTALIVIVIGWADGGPSGKTISWVFDSVLAPLEAAVASLLVFFLVAAAFRTMRKKPSLPILIFTLSTILVLVGTIPLPGDIGGVLSEMRIWLVRVFATAGARGMLLGVTLGTIATGLRVLVGIDKPHSERES